jgi:O-methyltransferase
MLKKLVKIFVLSVLSIFGNAKARYESRHSLLDSITKRLGYRMYNKNLSWYVDAEYQRVWAQFPAGKNSVHERKYTLYSIAKSLNYLEGDIAECGVFHGGSSFLMLSASAGTSKKLFGFDSFEGLSVPSPEDVIESAETFEWKAGDMSYQEEIALENLAVFSDRVFLYRGWIPSRFDCVNDANFCLVHIDVDLYEPTRESLEFFYGRLVTGGMIICDDYGFQTCPGAKQAMDDFVSENGLASVIHLPTGQGIIINHV